MLGGAPADPSLLAQLTLLDIEENADLSGAIQLHLPIHRSGADDLTHLNAAGLQPYANISVVATPEGGGDQCLFDGYVLAHRVHVDTGVTASHLQVWGQDATCLMNLEEKTKEWSDMSEGDVANAIFNTYGIQPASENAADNPPTHPESGHTLMQRGSDIQFLRRLARRSGRLCRIACADRPGQRTGYFAKPKLDGDTAVTLSPNDPDRPNVEAMNFAWDVMRPTSVVARQTVFDQTDADGVQGDSQDAGLTLLQQRGLADFAGRAMTTRLTAPVDDAGELTQRAQAVLRDAGWFVRCEGETDLARLNVILRVGTVVQVAHVGSLLSGKYYVWSVRHTLTPEHHKMRFTLVRNAVGPAQ
ncbi:MAG: hypothetical protein JWL77_3545 [Chthonomonadaceae bacterium]|nr:hypothetical protein [Chthonomonadaceae bacterium]